MEIEVKGIDSLRDKLKKLPQILNQATNQAMFEVTETIRSTAEDNAPVGIYTGGGELKGSIHAIVDNEDGKIVGRVWSDKKQAIFTEFGTGPRGQASPKDLHTRTVVYSCRFASTRRCRSLSFQTNQNRWTSLLSLLWSTSTALALSCN